MFVGHFSAGLLAKRAAPGLSLGTAVFAAILADIMGPLLVMAGVERIEFGSGRGAANYYHAIDVAFSHSLVTTLVWAVILAGLYLLTRRDRQGNRFSAALLIAAVVSHWVLDVVSHRPDMPLAPGVSTVLGLGLWGSVGATVVVEGGLWLAALFVYVRASRSVSSAGRWVFWSGAFILTLFWYNNIAGLPPSRPADAPMASLIFFLLATAWAYWMNRARRMKEAI